MFTRHLYEVDEVVAALHWSIAKGGPKEALFWALELLQSELVDTLRSELYSSWLYSIGIASLVGLHMLSSLQDTELLGVACALSRLPKDRSVVTLLLLGLDEKQPDRASFIPSLQTIECSDIERAFISALYQGKSRLAFAISRSLWQDNPTRVFDLLQQVQSIKQKDDYLAECLTLLEVSNDLCWPTRACAVAAVCLDRKRMKKSLQLFSVTLCEDLQEHLNLLLSFTGRRGRRVYKIPSECLYKRTVRGNLSNKTNTLSKLYTLTYKTLEGSPFWNRVIEEEAPWLDDDRLEGFHDLYFPDDIPDEWSKEDQEKSHGLGVLINQEVANNEKYMDRWFHYHPSLTYWLPKRSIRSYTQEKGWDELYERKWADVVSTWCLTPIKKRILVVIESS